MDDATAIDWARALGATVLEFNQPPKVCQTLCALWIRKQAKNASIFDGKRLYRADGIDQRPLWQQTAAFEVKVGKLYEKVQKYSGQSIEKEYIGGGRTARIVGLGAAKQDVHRVAAVHSMKCDFGEDGEGVNRVFHAIHKRKALGDIGYFMGSRAHAVALDCSKDNFGAIFFDPLIGQFSFPSYESFRTWWWKCWRRRFKGEEETNAWMEIKWALTIECDVYESMGR